MAEEERLQTFAIAQKLHRLRESVFRARNAVSRAGDPLAGIEEVIAE